MAITNATSGKTKPRKTTTQEVVTVEPAVIETVTEPEEPKRSGKAYKVKDTLDPGMFVPVRNGFNGKLIYKSRKTGERYVWEKFGDEQDMELRELRAAKTSYKAFYENNWFLIDDPEVIEYLGVERYYEHALSYDEFDSLFEMDPDELVARINLLSKGQKSSLSYRAKQLIREGGIDSIKVINSLERALGIELIEK